MTHNEFLRKLKKMGVNIDNGKGRHTIKLKYQGKQSQIGGHGTKEIGTGVQRAIFKQLGITGR